MFILISVLTFAIGQMPTATECRPMPLDPSTQNSYSSPNFTLKLPCLPPIERGMPNGPPSINEQEFLDCMQKEINKFSRLDNKTRAIFDSSRNLKIEMTKFPNRQLPSTLDEKLNEVADLLFDAIDTDKDGFLTADEISQFEVHFTFPYYLEMIIKDSQRTQFNRALAVFMVVGDLDGTKARSEKHAAENVELSDTNGDGKLNREEAQPIPI